MPLSAPVAFPLHPIVNGKCGCGNDKCTRIGKHPAVRWRDLELGSPVPLPAPGAGFGLKTGAAPKGSGVFVVDCDSTEALEAFAALGPVPPTFTVETPRGAHFYFKHPGFYVKNTASDLAKGVDTRGDGGYVVGPGSPHRSGSTYEIVEDLEPADAPAWLIAWLQARPAPPEIQTHEDDVQGEERVRRCKLFVEFCKTAPPSVEGDAGDEALFYVVQRGAYDYRLPTEDVREIIAEHFDPRCDPPWGDALEERVIHKCLDAKTKSTRPRLEPPSADDAEWQAALCAASPTPAQALDAVGPARAAKTKGIFWDDWDAPIDPPTWLVDGLIPVGTVGCLVAHGSSLKTWTALSLACAVAQGVHWLGKYPTRKGKAVIVDYESGDYELRRRVQLLEGGGRVTGLGAWSYPDKRIDDPELWKALAAIEGLELVVIDSLAEGTSPGVDENSKEAAFPLQLAARFTELTGATVVFIHHSKKDDGGDARKAVRGSTAIFAALDWCYGFTPGDEIGTARRMQMACIKACMGARPLPVPIELTDDGLHLYECEPRLERNASDEEIQKRILLLLQGGPVETKDLIAKKITMQAKIVRPHVDALKVRQEIAYVTGLGYVIDTPAARRKRVVDVVEAGTPWRTEAEIAHAAHVETAFVVELVRQCVIARSGEGRFVVVTQ